VAWTYVPGNVSQGGRDAVRFALGDVRPTDQLMADEEIDGALARTAAVAGVADYGAAAAACAEALAARFRNQVDLSAGSLRLSYAQRAQHWTEEAKRLRRISVSSHAPRAITTQTEYDAERADPDRRPDPFYDGLHDFPGIGGSGPPSGRDPLAP
jgi:hypothetical protein